MVRDLRDAAVDLLLGGRCVGCDRPGRLVCVDCAAMLPADAVCVRPSPAPPGLVPCWSAGDYAGLLQSLVLGLKEHRMLGLRAPLASLLAAAVRAAVPPHGPVLLVPVPSRAAAVRSRGHDPTRTVVGAAARLLRDHGRDVAAVPMLTLRQGVVDQAGLDAAARHANLAGSMCCPAPRLRRAAGRRSRAWVVVCDDVLTTGATAREAQRALEAVGVEVTAVATVAATRRRGHPGRSSLSPSPGRD